jgi:hypothetical protein
VVFTDHKHAPAAAALGALLLKGAVVTQPGKRLAQ